MTLSKWIRLNSALSHNIHALLQTSCLYIAPADHFIDMADVIPDYELCDTTRAVNLALAVLKTFDILAFDCEGQSLGAVDGHLSLVALRTMRGPSVHKTFLFDILRLDANSLIPVYDILRSTSIQKVVFDGRKDYSSLYHDFKVDLHNVLDLQLVDVKSRTARGERTDQQMNRLEAIMYKGVLVGKSRPMYVKVHRLNGLLTAVKEHGVPVIEKPAGQRFDHSHWMDRPLPVEYLQHVVEDVLLIHQLYNHFEGAGYLYSQISDDSARYVSIWKDSKPASSNMYRNHGLLPLDIIDHRNVAAASLGYCMSCERLLPKTCYTKWLAHSAASRKCFVCRAVEKSPMVKRHRKRAVAELQAKEAKE
ncbi:ribonuclease H-like domain-containing protein [Lyophyllum atratum]|nr:ribonuclease H-like domain-containing protein [Lyophyllum atratum]